MEDHEILAILKRTDPFEILEADILKQLSKKTGVKAYPPNSYVFRQGDQSLDRLFIIASGLVEITVTNDRGLESVVGLRREYDFLGETVILSQQRYPGSARVKEGAVCLVITRKQFEKLIYEQPEFSSFFNALLALGENLKKIGQGRSPDNYLDPYALRKRERILLKDALSGVIHLQKHVSQEQ